ncbi:N6-adenosine-methyltransferase catalytic subunit-like [Oppia nitens]|uniref:N6-adenosine-methyltransferase catalytic subunit-like n=1 Tax=Oppia nitens TaxID=1686743 RepID=UPI0023DBB3D2|nr:N6-adenosine-methyltransferase catalytic subunit-like [Oppia nitens]
MDGSSTDTFQEIQELRRKQNSLRERMQRRKKVREDILTGSAVCGQTTQTVTDNTPITDTPVIDKSKCEQMERKLLHFLSDQTLRLPIDSHVLYTHISKTCDQIDEQNCHQIVNDLLQKFLLQDMIVMSENLKTNIESTTVGIVYSITSIDHIKLMTFAQEVNAINGSEESKTTIESSGDNNAISDERDAKRVKIDNKTDDNLLESLLSLPTIREKQSKQMGEEILDLLSRPTAKERSIVEQFRSVGGAQVQEFCQHGTKEECMKANQTSSACSRLHFKKILQKHTDESLGDCSFLNTCFHMDTCKYVHYMVDSSTINKHKKFDSQTTNDQSNQLLPSNVSKIEGHFNRVLFPPQWIKCDLRFFDMNTLGKFSVVMADPPWDIHMELPYGTMSDDEMRNLQIPALQDEGIIFLWVTGRAMELGRECLSLWGYDRCDEIIWVKTNQLQRIIRTGRTGHWINHGKEHCLVGIKGNPPDINRGLDCDVIVAEVRATSHKPDEIYGIIERLSPGTRKLELFGRQHNTQPNWLTLGNQVGDVRLFDPFLIKSMRDNYPDIAQSIVTE